MLFFFFLRFKLKIQTNFYTLKLLSRVAFCLSSLTTSHVVYIDSVVYEAAAVVVVVVVAVVVVVVDLVLFQFGNFTFSRSIGC